MFHSQARLFGVGPDSKELGLVTVEEPSLPPLALTGMAAAVECHKSQGSGPGLFLAVSG